MAQFLLRLVLGIVVYLAFFAVLAPALHLMNLGISPDLLQILRIALAFAVLVYVAWGPAVPTPWRPGPPLA